MGVDAVWDSGIFRDRGGCCKGVEMKAAEDIQAEGGEWEWLILIN
jgi:hypothetical protein